MVPLIRVIPWLVLMFAAAGLVLGIYEWTDPPFSDQQIKASTLHTWEVATSTTRVFGIVFLGLGFVCVALARKAEDAARLVAYAAAVACLVALMIFVRNHIELTQRAAGLTGEEFGPLFGLL